MSILAPGDRVFIDSDKNDPNVILVDPTVWRSRPRAEGEPPEQADISHDVVQVTVSKETITVTGVDGSRAKAKHAPESSPGMRTGIVETVES